MINSKKQESRQRGSVSFPMEYYKIDTSLPDYDLPYHWHVEFEFIHILRGEYTIFAGSKEYVLKAGDFFLMSSGILHGDSEGFRGNCIYESLVFDPNIMRINNYLTEPFLEKLIDGELFFILQPDENNRDLINTISELFRIEKVQNSGYEYFTISRLFDLMAYISVNHLYEKNEHYMNEGGKLVWLKCVMNLIKQQYSTQITLDQMADSAGFSPKYFCRIFHEVTHYTPMDYLNQYRINRASEMLLRTDETIEEISYNVGINDISYFIKLFKRYKNITPLKYRNSGIEKSEVHKQLANL